MKLVTNLDDPNDIQASLQLLTVYSALPGQAGAAQPPAAPRAPAAPAAPAAPPMTAPPPAAPPAPAAAAPAPAPAAVPAPAPPAPPASQGQWNDTAWAAHVNAFAKAYTAKACKARFTELATAFGQPAWTSTTAIPLDRRAEVAPWFNVAA